MTHVAGDEASALVPVNLGEHFEITPTGLIVHGKPSFDLCEQLGGILRTLEKGIQFAIGDYCRYVEGRFGERASQLIDATGWAYETVRSYTWTAEKVSPDVRRLDTLSFTHHQAVARLNPREQKKWLAEASAGDEGKPWSVARLKQAIKADADPPITEWVIVARFKSEAKRKEALSWLSGFGAVCSTSEKRG